MFESSDLFECFWLFLQDVLNSMKSLEKIFKASYLKGDGSTPSHTPDIAALHNSAISAWSLLLSIAPPSTVQSFLDRSVCRVLRYI